MSESRTTYLAGVDGGGTGCRAAIADRTGKVLGRGEAGPANATTDADQAIANVRKALAQAADAAGLGQRDMARCCAHIGLAGALDEAIAAKIARGLTLEHATVSDDRATSVVGALGSRDGVLAAIGTGSTLAATRKGTLLRVGGWGLNLGDQASGAWLGKALLEHVLLCHDGLAEHSPLTRAVLDEFDGPGGLVALARAARPADYATFAPRIIAAGQSDDPTGTMLMQRGADYLLGALNALRFRETDVLCLTGGIGPHYSGYLTEPLRQRIVAPDGNALDGALQLARAALERVEA